MMTMISIMMIYIIPKTQTHHTTLINIDVRVCVCVRMRACVSVSVCCVCVCVCMRACVCVSVRTSVSACVCVCLVGWLFGFYGISTFVGYLTPNSVYMCLHSTKISERILSW